MARSFKGGSGLASERKNISRESEFDARGFVYNGGFYDVVET